MHLRYCYNKSFVFQIICLTTTISFWVLFDHEKERIKSAMPVRRSNSHAMLKILIDERSEETKPLPVVKSLEYYQDQQDLALLDPAKLAFLSVQALLFRLRSARFWPLEF